MRQEAFLNDIDRVEYPGIDSFIYKARVHKGNSGCGTRVSSNT